MANSDGIRASRRWAAAGGIAAALATAGPLAAQTRTSDDYRLLTDGLNAAGGTAASADYRETAAAGGLSGIHRSAAISDRSGYPGQLHDVVAIIFPASPVTLDENESVTLTVSERWDDGTWLVPAAGNVLWTVEYGSAAASISADGLLRTHPVSSSTVVHVTASRYGFHVVLTLIVRDSDSDNFGFYAGDGLPDWWQVLHFGFENPLAAPGLDPDNDGVDNLGEFLAQTPPLDPRGRLAVDIAAGPDGPGLLFTPADTGRYLVESSAALADWSPAGDEFPAEAGEPLVIPLPVAPDGRRVFFRIVRVD